MLRCALVESPRHAVCLCCWGCQHAVYPRVCRRLAVIIQTQTIKCISFFKNLFVNERFKKIAEILCISEVTLLFFYFANVVHAIILVSFPSKASMVSSHSLLFTFSFPSAVDTADLPCQLYGRVKNKNRAWINYSLDALDLVVLRISTSEVMLSESVEATFPCFFCINQIWLVLICCQPRCRS